MSAAKALRFVAKSSGLEVVATLRDDRPLYAEVEFEGRYGKHTICQAAGSLYEFAQRAHAHALGFAFANGASDDEAFAWAESVRHELLAPSAWAGGVR